jgi:hypothetical protein
MVVVKKARFRIDAAVGPTGEQLVEVIVDGVALREMWHRVAGEPASAVRVADVVWPGHQLWLGEEPLNSELGEGDRRVVLLCDDGLTGCGGANARIVIDEATVTWSDFEKLPSGDRVPLGPFIFDRRKYEAALRELKGAAR